MNFLLLNSLLAIAWAALMGGVSVWSLFTGYVLGYFALWFARGATTGMAGDQYFRAVPKGIVLTVYFFKELIMSSIRVARDAFSLRPNLHPAIVRMPLDVTTDVEIFLVANLISLTPGTLTLDVAEDRSHLVIHSIYGEDPVALVAELKGGMERRVREVFET